MQFKPNKGQKTAMYPALRKKSLPVPAYWAAQMQGPLHESGCLHNDLFSQFQLASSGFGYLEKEMLHSIKGTPVPA